MRKTPSPPRRKLVNFNKPRREYETIRLGKWDAIVEKQLLADVPDLAEQVLVRLKKKRGEALAALPEASRAVLKKLSFYLLYGPNAKGGGRDSGLEYFQKDAPKHHRNLDPRWSNCVVIYSTENYARISDFWAIKALVHEFAHAYQLEQWPEDQPDILQAWENATKHRLYHNVNHDDGEKVAKAYASVNQLEYFAELSCMYFVGCDYQPFNRKELKSYDPVGYAMIQNMWDVQK